MLMSLTKFGPSIRTIFVDGDGKRAESTYVLKAGVSGELKRTNSETIKNGVWSLELDEPAQIAFARGIYSFRKATIVQNDNGFEMVITLLFRKDFASEKLIYSVKEL
ncbi:MAG TPA: hypothetical protein VGN40_16085 [Lelliottia sp.]